ncbi:MAG TPA: prepilin peptidase [Gemmatimonadaceae bacterium]|nr:prepilin peptidase [Gemmatimonadaceae bacterium]
MTETAVRVMAFVLGAAWGSFLNVCISRWPAGLSVVAPRSRCPSCERPITWYENIPVLSWVALRARCRGCGKPISIMYPLVELAVGFAWLASVAHFGPTLTALRVAVFVTLLLGIAMTDARHYTIPDGFTVFGLLWMMTLSVVGLMAGEPGPFALPYDALIGACAGAGAISIAGWLGELALKKEAMGYGDMTLMAMVGAAVGPQLALLTIFLAAALGTVAYVLVIYPVRVIRLKRDRHGGVDPAEDGDGLVPIIPFGVFLAPAAVIALLWGGAMIKWYLTSVIKYG